MKKILKFIKWFLISFVTLILLIVIGLTIYTFDASTPENEMYETIDTLDVSSLKINHHWDSYFISHSNPKGNIIIIPGGKVYTESYLFLAYSLALEGYQVHISKALFHLAILTPTYTKKFLSSTLPNIVIGHSLGGTVGGLITGSSQLIDYLILLGSYTTNKITHANVLLLTAEHDQVINHENFNQSLSNYSDYTHYDIAGGNHAGFGWYGKQKGDGKSTITTYEQQMIVVSYIISFINPDI